MVRRDVAARDERATAVLKRGELYCATVLKRGKAVV